MKIDDISLLVWSRTLVGSGNKNTHIPSRL